MGVVGYYDMKLIWEREDKEAVAAGGSPAFSEIKGECARTTCRHVQKGVMTDLITLKTHVMPNCMK